MPFLGHACAWSTRPEASVTAEAPRTAGLPHRHLPLALLVGAGVLLADQLTKWWATRSLADDSIELFWTLRLHLVSNTGASFSIGEGFGPIIGVIALGVVGVLLWSGRTVDTRPGAIGLGLVLGGALGNVLDRAFRAGDGFMAGAVVDWIDLQWWPVFNLADAGVVIGAVVLVVAAGRQESSGDEDPSGGAPSSEAPDPTPAEADRGALPGPHR